MSFRANLPEELIALLLVNLVPVPDSLTMGDSNSCLIDYEPGNNPVIQSKVSSSCRMTYAFHADYPRTRRAAW